MRWILLGLIAAAALGSLLYWRHRRRKRHRLISLVAMLREPNTFEAAVLARIAGGAWKADLGDGDEEGEDGFVVCADIVNTIMCKGRMYLINCFARPYVDDPDEIADSIPDRRLGTLMREHTAWFSVDAMGTDYTTPEKEILAEYRRIGRLMADLIDGNVLMLYCPDLSSGFPINDETELALRSKNPLKRLQETLTVPIINISDDDPAMMAAVEQAKAEWSKFVSAFEKRRGENHAVKAPITRGGNTEFIWISVTAIEGDRIYGELANEPGDLGNLKLGSKVSTPLEDLNDWMYLDDDELIGGFTVKVVENAAKRKPQKE